MRIKSRHTDEEKEACINECLNGADKYYLSGKYDVSIRTIDRWIANSGVSEVELRISRRQDKIPIDIQYEVFKVLSSNPIFYGYNTSEWNVNRVINYIKSTYDININWRMAKALMEDAIHSAYIYSIDQAYDDIGRLSELGYSIVLLDYIKIGRIKMLEVEPLGIRDYTEDILDVNLVIARADENVYLDVIVSELEIVDKKRGTTIYKTSDKEERIKEDFQRKVIVNDKYELLNKIKEAEKKRKLKKNEVEKKEEIIFISTYDRDIEKLQRKRSNIRYFIVSEDIYSELLQNKYEGEYVKSIVQYMYNDNNRNRRFRNVADIRNTVCGKVESYVLKVTNDKNEIINAIKDENKKQDSLAKMGKIERKCFKTLNNNYIYNI